MFSRAVLDLTHVPKLVKTARQYMAAPCAQHEASALLPQQAFVPLAAATARAFRRRKRRAQVGAAFCAVVKHDVVAMV